MNSNGQIAKCEHRGEPAACVGQYETMEEMAFACDECCGHGCEDGFCHRLAQALDSAAKQEGGDGDDVR